MLLEILERHHFTCYKPYGAYYIMTDIGHFGFSDDVAFAVAEPQLGLAVL